MGWNCWCPSPNWPQSFRPNKYSWPPEGESSRALCGKEPTAAEHRHQKHTQCQENLVCSTEPVPVHLALTLHLLMPRLLPSQPEVPCGLIAVAWRGRVWGWLGCDRYVEIWVNRAGGRGEGTASVSSGQGPCQRQ